MKRFLRAIWRAVKWSFIVLCLFVFSLFFREQRLPVSLTERLLDGLTPTNLTFHVDSLAFGFQRGLTVRGLKIYDSSKADPLSILAGADLVSYYPLTRHLFIDGAQYRRLPDGYYAPGNKEKNARVEAVLPDLGDFTFELVGGNILGISPLRLTGKMSVSPRRFVADHLLLEWPDRDVRMTLDGFCRVDLDRQEIYGEVDGLARQGNIRPLIEALDVPVALPYFDGFTEVPGAVPSWCSWQVNLVNNDFDLRLHLRPKMGKYNAVPMSKADGRIHLHIYTRGTSLNYRQTIGPIEAVGPNGEPLKGTVVVAGTNGYNTVDVDAESALPVADLLRIGGFTGKYVSDDVLGKSKCRLQFRFPRAMTNNYEVLNGFGHVEIRDGRLMRLKGFRGLMEAMPSTAPAFSWMSDSTRASGDYVIENGVVKSDNIVIDGTLFSIKMFGSFDAVHDKLDFTVRVEFASSDSFVGKLLHPLTWAFTKLVLEFRLGGSAANPEWKYITVVDRVLEAVR